MKIGTQMTILLRQIVAIEALSSTVYDFSFKPVSLCHEGDVILMTL